MAPTFRTLAALGLLAIPLAACTEGRSQEPAAEERRAVVVETVRFAPREGERSFVGQIRPRIESDLGFRVAGKVAERLVQPGERVQNGQVLMRLDPIDLRLSREQAQAELRAAQVNLEQTLAQERRQQDLRRQGWRPTPLSSNASPRPPRREAGSTAPRAPSILPTTSSPMPSFAPTATVS